MLDTVIHFQQCNYLQGCSYHLTLSKSQICNMNSQYSYQKLPVY